jgi:hypothetical protein
VPIGTAVFRGDDRRTHNPAKRHGKHKSFTLIL